MQTVKDVLEIVVPSLRFWTLKFTAGMFAWPKDLLLLDQVAFAVSTSVLSLNFNFKFLWCSLPIQKFEVLC